MERDILMKLIYKGKTKDVYQSNDGNIKLHFKDDVTGENGKFDPGANTVGTKVKGAGKSGLHMSTLFFKKLESLGVPTHFIHTNMDELMMTVKDVDMFGDGIEVICRYRAVGSFYRRYGAYCEEGQALDCFVEFTLKDDEREDPPITKDGLIALNILTNEQYDEIKHLTEKTASIVKETLREKGLELYDIKFEFGCDKETGNILLIDEISGGNMRVYKGSAFVEPLELGALLFEK